MIKSVISICHKGDWSGGVESFSVSYHCPVCKQ